MTTPTARRPLKSRQTKWAKMLAAMLAKAGISPNMISFFSIVFAGLALATAIDGHPFHTALAIQLRLICNLMDGMVAVEYGKKSKVGDLWNDVPDRLADVLIILAAGHFTKDAPFATELIWSNAAFAVFTAYIRVLGASLKSPHYYIGPMAKPQRMALLTAVLVIHALRSAEGLIYGSLIIMLLGQIVTCFRRLLRIKNDLENA